MKTIRSNCFETNSSSTHSVTIDSSTARDLNVEGVKIFPDEFGWEWRKINSFAEKASYFWTLVADYPRDDTADLKDRMERLAETYGFELIPAEASSYTYVDHGWEHYESMIKKYPELNTDEGLFEFLTSKSGWIMLGNDNTMGEPNSRLSPLQIENAPSYLILDIDPTIRYAMVGEDLTEEHWADEAIHYWDQKSDRPLGSGWIKVLDISGGEVKCIIEKYDFQTSETTVVKEFTLTYTIEHNAKYIAPSL